MWMARTGDEWRHLPDEYGKWNSVFRRYRRWVETGVFDALLETLAEMVERDTSADMIDSTVVRAHHCAIGLRDQEAQGLGRSRGGFTTKLHARCDGHLTTRFRPDAGSGARRTGLWPAVPDARRPHRSTARGQGL